MELLIEKKETEIKYYILNTKILLCSTTFLLFPYKQKKKRSNTVRVYCVVMCTYQERGED